MATVIIPCGARDGSDFEKTAPATFVNQSKVIEYPTNCIEHGIVKETFKDQNGDTFTNPDPYVNE